MALTLDPDKSYVVYESWKKKRNFYCIERTGYTKVNELVNDFLYHAVDVHNAMTLCNITFVETYKIDSASYAADPEIFRHNYVLSLSERKRQVSNRGVGYAVGDILEFTDPNATSNQVQEGRETVKIKVTSINAATGGITDFETMHPGSYRTPTSTSKALVFRTKQNAFAADELHLDVSYMTDNRGTLAAGYTNDAQGNIFIFQGRHEGIGNVWVPTTAPGTVGNPALGYWQYGPTVHKSYKGAVARLENVIYSPNATLPSSGQPALTAPGPTPPSFSWTWYHTDVATGKTILQTTYNTNVRQTKSMAVIKDVDSVLGIDPWTQTFGYSHSQKLPGTAATPYLPQPFGSGDTTSGRGGDGDLASLSNVQFGIGSTFTYGTSYDPISQSFYGNLTRWPTDGIWTNVDISTNTVLFPGQEIILVEAQSNSESYIPPGTRITDMASIEVVNGVREIKNVKSQTIVGIGGGTYVRSSGSNTFFETTARYIWFRTSNPIKIDKGDRFVVRGNGASFSDTTSIVPEKFTLVTEVAASADALADTQGFLANVKFRDSTGANLMIEKMTTPHSRISAYPYLGQLMTLVYPSPAAVSASYAIVGNLNAVISNIANVNVDNGTANITIAVPQGAPLIDSTVKFAFPVLQPWRMAFKAENSQQLNVFAGTKIQLQDSGDIARVTDYSGSVNDLSGLIGSIPTIKKFSTTASATCSVNFGWANVTATGQLSGITVGGPFTFTTFKQKYGVDANVVIAVTTKTGAAITSGMEFNEKTGAPSNTVMQNKILYQVKPLETGETEGGLGKYVVEKNNQTFNPVTTVTGLVIGQVEDVEVDPTDITQGFVNRELRVAQHPESYPLSFMATFTTRGIFFGVWEGSWTVMQKSKTRQVSERDAWFNWVLCQRPVDRNTGHTRTSGQSPVFCVNSVGYKYWKFIVRERDTVHPTQGDKETKHYLWDKQYQPNGGVFEKYTPFRVPADKHTEDSHALLNTTEQIALTEDSKYLVSFLYNLTTPRFRYSDELDMIGQTAADVAMASNNLKLTTYGEPNERTYRSLGANLPYNMGLRIVVLNDLYQN